MDSESQKGTRRGLQMFSHSRRPKQSVYPLCSAGVVLPKQLEQLDGYAWLTLKKCASKGTYMVSVVTTPDRAMSKQLAYTIKGGRNIVFRLKPLTAIRIETGKTQTGQSGVERR